MESSADITCHGGLPLFEELGKAMTLCAGCLLLPTPADDDDDDGDGDDESALAPSRLVVFLCFPPGPAPVLFLFFFLLFAFVDPPPFLLPGEPPPPPLRLPPAMHNVLDDMYGCMKFALGYSYGDTTNALTPISDFMVVVLSRRYIDVTRREIMDNADGPAADFRRRRR